MLGCTYTHICKGLASGVEDSHAVKAAEAPLDQVTEKLEPISCACRAGPKPALEACPTTPREGVEGDIPEQAPDIALAEIAAAVLLAPKP